MQNQKFDSKEFDEKTAPGTHPIAILQQPHCEQGFSEWPKNLEFI